MIEYGLEWHTLTSYLQFKEVTAPATPQANQIRQYCKDSSGVSTMCWKNDAGVEFCLPTGGGGTIPITSGGEAGKMAYFTSTTNLSGADNPSGGSVLLQQTGVSTLTLSLNLFAFSDDSNGRRPIFAGKSSRGTKASPTTLATDDSLVELLGAGRFGTVDANAAAIRLRAGPGTINSTSAPSYIMFETTPDLTLGRREVARFAPDGDLLVVNTTHTVAAIAGRGISSFRNTNAEIGVYSFVTGGTITSGYRAGVFGGTITSPGASQTGQGGFYASMFRDSSNNMYSPSLMGLYCAESPTPTARGSYITFETTALLATTRAERFRIGPSGQWGIGGVTFGTALDVFTSGGASAAPTWTAPGALTKTDDTNVTLTLGGTPATALLRAASLTLGWTGQLAISRGGTGQATANAALNALLPSQTTHSGEFLKTDGTNTSWAASVGSNHDLLDGSVNQDTLAGTVVRGDIIRGNSTPKWSRLAVGTTGQYLGSDGTDVLWRAQSTLDHGSIGGLSDDDHTEYARLAGRSGGQTIIGGTGSGEHLKLDGSSHAVDGAVQFLTRGEPSGANYNWGTTSARWGTLAALAIDLSNPGGSNGNIAGSNIKFTQDSNDAFPYQVTWLKTRSGGNLSSGDILGDFAFNGRTGGSEKQFGLIRFNLADATSTSEDTTLSIYNTRAGTIEEAARFEVPADGEVGLLILQNVGGSFNLRRVSMGGANSGGAGFKLLRVVN